MKENSKNIEKMTAGDYAPTFVEYYKALPSTPKPPKQAFVEEIAALTMSSQQTVRCWLCGRQRPDALRQKLISERLGYSVEQLFPLTADESD